MLISPLLVLATPAVLKAQRKEQEAAEKAAEISLEEFLEMQRHRLPTANLTPVTAESFAAWKKQRVDKKAAEEEAIKSKKASQAQANKLAGLSGKDMFTLNPEMFADEDDEGGDGEVSFMRRSSFNQYESNAKLCSTLLSSISQTTSRIGSKVLMMERMRRRLTMMKKKTMMTMKTTEKGQRMVHRMVMKSASTAMVMRERKRDVTNL